LARLLDSLAHLDTPSSRFEVIVVDDGGPDDVEQSVRRFQEKLDLRVERQENGGPAAARNRGAESAGGEYLAFVDDDCSVDPGWLEGMGEALRERPSILCGGRVVNALVDNPYAVASQLLLDYLHRHYAPEEHLGGFFTTNNLCLPRSDFESMGGFDSSLRFGEDRDLCYRWALAGGGFRVVPEAVVRHFHDVRLTGLLRLHFCYGGGSYGLHRKVAEQGQPRVDLSPPSFYAGLVLSGARRRPGLGGIGLSALLAAMLAANATGMVWRALEHRLMASRRCLRRDGDRSADGCGTMSQTRSEVETE
jgi:glycosyltransferase involved in cell wall biosynthesis